MDMLVVDYIYASTLIEKHHGLVRDLNPGPLAPKARIIPLDQRAIAEERRRKW